MFGVLVQHLDQNIAHTVTNSFFLKEKGDLILIIFGAF